MAGDYNINVYQNPSANGDSFSQSFFLGAGTYTFSVMGRTEGDAGKIDWYIDNVLAVSGQDWYYGGANQHGYVQTASVTVSGNGVHTLKGIVNGKTGSNYYILLTTMWFS